MDVKRFFKTVPFLLCGRGLGELVDSHCAPVFLATNRVCKQPPVLTQSVQNTDVNLQDNALAGLRPICSAV